MQNENVREVLEGAFDAIYGEEPPSGFNPKAFGQGKPFFSPAWDKWIEANSRFTTLLDAEAYLDAAMMLVPEGWTYVIDTATPDGQADVGLWNPGGYCTVGAFCGEEPCRHKIPAIALATAALKAKEQP